jgi:predicted enzyme related to lactoylglutathione lyase
MQGVGGAIVYGNGYKPSADGTVVYLNAGEDLNIILNRVVPAGGKAVTPKILITEEIGYSAFFIDTEGNRVGLHSAK